MSHNRVKVTQAKPYKNIYKKFHPAGEPIGTNRSERQKRSVGIVAT